MGVARRIATMPYAGEVRAEVLDVRRLQRQAEMKR